MQRFTRIPDSDYTVRSNREDYIDLNDITGFECYNDTGTITLYLGSGVNKKLGPFDEDTYNSFIDLLLTQGE